MLIKTIFKPSKNFSLYKIQTLYILSCNVVKKHFKHFNFPRGFFVFQKKDAFVLKCSSTYSTFSLFNFISILFENWVQSLRRPARKILIVKGLGYKTFVDFGKTLLTLKLGFSHIIKIPLEDKNVIIRVIKQFIVVEGFNPAQVGNFASVLENIRNPSSYREKGIYLKGKLITLKELKKK